MTAPEMLHAAVKLAAPEDNAMRMIWVTLLVLAVILFAAPARILARRYTEKVKRWRNRESEPCSICQAVALKQEQLEERIIKLERGRRR